MPVRQRKPNEIAQQVVPLLLLGIGLVTTNKFVTFNDDESTILGVASNPLRTTLALFFSGSGRHEHPPLYDILLHFWLHWTGGNFDYLRIPSILFFIAGLFLLGRASRHFAGSSGGIAVIWVGVLWPFGFHFGRLADAASVDDDKVGDFEDAGWQEAAVVECSVESLGVGLIHLTADGPDVVAQACLP